MDTEEAMDNHLAQQFLRTPSVIISDWLRLCRAGQWTPLEAAQQILRELDREGFIVVSKNVRVL